MPSFRVIATQTYPSAREDRIGKTDRASIIETDTGQRHTVIIPDEDHTDARLKSAVERLLKQDGSLNNRTFTL